MGKYIDAEKLKEEIARLKQPFKKDIEDGVYPTYLCALLDFEELIEQSKLYKDESLGSPDYERGFKHGREYQSDVERKYTNKDKVVAYLVDKGYPVCTKGEIPTYQETFDMIKNAIKYANQQKQSDLSNNLVDVDAVREDFITEVYRVLDADSTNDRANAIIGAFDSLPTICQEQSEVGLVAEIKVVYPDNPKRKEIGFYYNKKKVSWEDMLLADRMHDYPYYFRDGMDYYPFMPEQKPAKKDDIGYDLGRGKWMETHEKNWNTAIMTLEEAITHCKEKACGNTQCAIEHRQLAEWLQELQQYRQNARKEETKQPEYGYITTKYIPGKKPRGKVGSILAYYINNSDEEGEVVLGKVVNIEPDEDAGWLYTFENEDVWDEETLIREGTYEK